MADNATPALLDPLPPAPGDWRGRAQAFLAQPALKRSLPAIAGLGALGGAGLLYLMLADGPQRMLYASLSDGERAEVVAALDTAGIGYTIDNATGALSVGEDDLYRARMLVASETALATPDSGTAMLDTIPLGASRTLEGERLKLARERELMLTIKEIDGIEAVRVHLATPERSVFVRENSPASASVMIRLARGRSLTPDQVDAITNLVAASVPGLQGQMVRVVDQNGRLLSAVRDGVADGLTLQREHEAKLREQLDKLLIPLLGEGNFSSEVQVELAREESTSARETYDKEGVIQSEAENRSLRATPGAVGGVPGVLANTPPPPAELVPGAPQGTQGQPGAPGSDEETSARRSYAVGREVAVTSVAPGGVARISVAVAVSQEALRKIAPANEARLRALVEAAVGAVADRGDQVTVVVGKFEPATLEDPPFYETGWFAAALRYGSAILALLLVLLFGVRPLLGILRGKSEQAVENADDEIDVEKPAEARPALTGDALREQVALARQLAVEQPDRAVVALQRMLGAPTQGGER
ncbi:MAG: flagellar basal-body MS-ring/collar protein FliF [Sphingomonadaceae bacterium]